MNAGKIATLLAAVLFLPSPGGAASKSAMRIKVLDSETRSVGVGGDSVPNDCDQVTFDAYCRASGRTAELVSTLLVQDGDDPPFRISCTMESRFSKCTPLPVGESFDARKEKHGIAVYYADGNGKVRKQLYSLVVNGKNGPGTASPAATPAAPAAPRTGPQAQVSPVPLSPPPSSTAAHVATSSESAEKVRCGFTSSPSGADLLLDGKYVGSTPSEIEVSPGPHAIMLSMPGFAQWQRDLTVTAGSKLTVNAILQKQ